MTISFREAGRRGGLANLNQHGREYMREIGQRGGLVGAGGRPRLKTVEETVEALRKEKAPTGSYRERLIRLISK